MASLSPEAGLKLLESGDFSDFTIECRNYQFKVHRAILCPGSSFFQAMCQSLFKRCSTLPLLRKLRRLSAHLLQENLENRVSLPDDDPDIVCLVLLYLYTSIYDLEAPIRAAFLQSVEDRAPEQLFSLAIQGMESEHGDAQSKSSVSVKMPSAALYREGLVHVAVYVCADRLGISKLKTLASQKFMTVANIIDETNFAGLLDAVYEKTAAQDSTLRATATQHSLRLVTRSKAVPRLVEVLKQHEPMVWAMTELFKDELKLVKEGTKLKDKDANEELSNQRTLLQRQTKEFQMLKDFVEGGKRHCMRCGKKFERVGVTCIGDGSIRITCHAQSCYHKNII